MFYSLSNTSVDFKNFIWGNKSNAFKNIAYLSKGQEQMTGKNLQGISFVSGFNFYCIQIFHQFLIRSPVNKLQARVASRGMMWIVVHF